MKAKATRPSALVFNCEVITGDFRQFTKRFFALLAERGLPAITEWVDYRVRDGRPDTFADAVEKLPASPAQSGDGPVYLQIDTAGAVIGSTKFHPKWRDSALCSANLQWVTRDEDGIEVLLGFQGHCLEICRALLREFRVYSADLRPERDAMCVPDVPLVDVNSHIVVTNRAEAEEFYDDPAVFWDSGWNVVEEREGQRLLARDMDAVAGPDLLARIIEPQWAMARAAKPGETRYEGPYVTPAEEPIFRSGEKTLHFVGYDEDEKLIEYSCALTRGEHVRGWEVFALLGIVSDKKTPDGAQVETVRVVFLEEWAARQEKRPLLDVGCRVFHYDEAGELRELTE
jgi:hypothetical protein